MKVFTILQKCSTIINIKVIECEPDEKWTYNSKM